MGATHAWPFASNVQRTDPMAKAAISRNQPHRHTSCEKGKAFAALAVERCRVLWICMLFLIAVFSVCTSFRSLTERQHIRSNVKHVLLLCSYNTVLQWNLLVHLNWGVRCSCLLSVATFWIRRNFALEQHCSRTCMRSPTGKPSSIFFQWVHTVGDSGR